MSQFASWHLPKLLWLLLAAVVAALVIASTVNPWPVAAKKLAAIGPGPYVPLSYSWHSVTSDKGTRESRSQTYLVVSQIGRSLSTFRVTEEDKVAKVEEVRFGFLYGALLLVVLAIGEILGPRSFSPELATRANRCLTPPSSGRPKGFAFVPPLTSNVRHRRPHEHCSRA